MPASQKKRPHADGESDASAPPVRKGAKMAPRSADAPRADDDCVWRVARSPIGTLSLCASDAGVVELHFAPQDAPLSPPPRTPRERQADAWLARVVEHLAAASRSPLQLPLDLRRGTLFQRRVWAAMCAVPPGETTTYGALAKALASSPRAVGQAVGRNPVGIVQPCHRVCAGGGKLGGFAWGPDAKRALLRCEGVEPPPE